MNGTRAYHGGSQSRDDCGTATEMLGTGRFDGNALITDRIRLADIVDEGFERPPEDGSSVKVVAGHD
jgi:Zn-dependent alcohol dehydrogenase